MKWFSGPGPGEGKDIAERAADMAVEEVFLEGDNAVVIHHSAGSDQATRLLEDSGIHKLVVDGDDD